MIGRFRGRSPLPGVVRIPALTARPNVASANAATLSVAGWNTTVLGRLAEEDELPPLGSTGSSLRLVDAVYLAFMPVVFAMNQWGLLYTKDVIRELAIPIVLLPLVVATAASAGLRRPDDRKSERVA